MELEFHQLDRRWEHLRARHAQGQRRLMASLAATGQQTPVVVTAGAEPDRYVVIDGYKRVSALEQLGRDTVEAVEWQLSEASAVMLTRSIQMSGHLTALEEGWLLAELEMRFGYELEELARRFDRSAGWVKRRLALVELLPQGVQQQVREGKVSAHVATKFLAAVAGVSLTDCQRLADAFAREQFTAKQTQELYAAWRDGSPVQRQRIVEQPELFVKATSRSQPPSPSRPDCELLRDLNAMLAISKRANRRGKWAAAEMDERQRQQARRRIGLVIEQLNQLANALSNHEPRSEEKPGEKGYVEQRSANGDPGTGGSRSEPSSDRTGNGNLPPNGASRGWLELLRSPTSATSREGRTLSPGDTRTAGEVQRESGPGP